MTKLSMVALMLTTLATSAMAEEPKFDMGGQGVFYYQTNNGGNNDFLDKESSSASAGLELDAKLDFGDNLIMGAQGTYLGTLGLEKWMISNSRQNAKVDDKNDVALTKLFIADKIANTSLKIGRQELAKSYSPFAFSEYWNVFSNRFDAVLIQNEDIPDTKLYGAYIKRSSHHNGLNHFDDLSGNTDRLGFNVLEKGAYLVTAKNESIKNMPITGSYYKFQNNNSSDVDVVWADMKLQQFPVKVAFQAGEIDPDANVKTTKAYGAKLSTPLAMTNISLSYSHVNDGDVELRNFGTGIKTPLYTQMIGNQNFTSSDCDSYVLKTVTKLPKGKLIATYDNTKDNSVASNDYQELDVVYKFKAYNMNMLLAYIGQKTDNSTFSGENRANNLRFWTRYNF